MSTTLLSRLTDLKSQVGTNLQSWPNPQDSIGTWYRKLGRCQCWEMCGEARVQYLLLARDIKEYLEKHGELVTDTVIWSAYMVGPRKCSATPTIFFCSRLSSARKTVRREIDHSGILEGYPWFRTADSIRPPHLEEVRQLTSSQTTNSVVPRLRSQSCRNPIGTTFLVSHGDSARMTPATFGVVLESSDTLYVCTVAHAFLDSYENDGSPSQHDLDFEFDFDDIDDCSSDVESGEDIKNSNTGDESKSVCTAAPSACCEPFDNSCEPGSPDHECLIYYETDVVFSSSSHFGSGLDYCILRLNDEDLRAMQKSAGLVGSCDFHSVYPTAISDSQPQDSNVIAYTGSQRARNGKLSGTPVYWTVAAGGKTQELWSVQFDGTLALGDCGSIVVNESTAELEGHIVAGSPSTGVALIVPAHEIFKDLWDRFDKDIAISLAFSECKASTQRLHEANSNMLSKNTLAHEVAPLNAETFTQDFQNLLRIKVQPEEAEVRNEESELSNPHVKEHTFAQPPSYSTACNLHTSLRPAQPDQSSRFSRFLTAISETPLKWEDPRLLNEALFEIPLVQIRKGAQQQLAEYETATKSPVDNTPPWGYQDYVIRELMKWFKRDFFEWINNPRCSVCGCPTVAQGRTNPLAEEAARGALRVELYRCSIAQCQAYERFPRYVNAFELMRTKRGRIAEWVNCFGMLCRALGSKVRWVWNAEDHVWIEVFSEYRQRWVHVDCCEEAWDAPLLYTQGWRKKLSYCIAFSSEGATDVTCRYLRSSEHTLPRSKASEGDLFHILDHIRRSRRESLSTEDRLQESRIDVREQHEFQRYRSERLAADICRAAASQGIGTDRRGTQATRNPFRKDLEGPSPCEIRNRVEGCQFQSMGSSTSKTGAASLDISFLLRDTLP